jgi:hypothetical protein
MKSKLSRWISALAFATAAAMPAQQASSQATVAHHKYKLIGTGTNGAPGALFRSPGFRVLNSGGTATGQERPLLASSSSISFAPVVLQAIAAAQARINASKKCQRFFNNQGIEMMEQTHYSLQDLGPGSVAAMVDGDSVFLNLNAKGAFMNPPADFAGVQTVEEIRGFYVLHELGHELSRVTKFVMDRSASKSVNKFRHDSNNDLLRANCY